MPPLGGGILATPMSMSRRTKVAKKGMRASRPRKRRAGVGPSNAAVMMNRLGTGL